ncbi:unnamed protein product [Calypogeia fissa]
MATLVLGVAFASGLCQLARMTKRCIADKKMVSSAPKRQRHQLIYVHEVLSCLVDNVYARDKRKPPEIKWVNLGYEPITPAALSIHGYEAYGGEDANRHDSHDHTARFMIFRRVGDGVYIHIYVYMT